jgi:hypothetical protein
MAEVMWQILIGSGSNQNVTRGIFWTMIGCHVAQSWAATWHPGISYWFVCQNILESVGFDPRTSPPHRAFTKSARPTDHRLRLVMYASYYVFEFTYCNVWRGVGPGLSPDPRSYRLLHVTIYIYIYILCCNGSSPGHICITSVEWRGICV